VLALLYQILAGAVKVFFIQGGVFGTPWAASPTKSNNKTTKKPSAFLNRRRLF